MKTAIVTTTINIPYALEGYAKSAKQYGHSDAAFIVIADLKTPSGAKKFCEKLAKDNSYQVIFLDVENQKNYLKRYPELDYFLPYNSVSRRNIGLLLAYEEDAEKIITIDDDNFYVSGDFIGQHSVVGEYKTLDALASSTGWLNVCEFLEEKQGYQFFHRGYPMGERWKRGKVTQTQKKERVVVNAGFWLGDPDIDAVTRIVLAPEVVKYKRKGNFCLQEGTWSPFNSQNTALAREVIPAYFLSPHIGRNADIWASYIVRKIADHLKEFVSYGSPLVKQIRNKHNLLHDLEKEMDSMRLVDRFCEHLRNIKLQGKNYLECLAELAAKLPGALQQDKTFSAKDVTMLNNFCKGLQIWEQTINRV